MKIEDRGSNSDIGCDSRSSILNRVSVKFLHATWVHRFQRAVSAKDALIGSAAPRTRIVCFEYIARKHLLPDPSALSPPNALLSMTAHWKRCVPSFVTTTPQKLQAPTPQPQYC